MKQIYEGTSLFAQFQNAGYVYSDYALIPFEMETVNVQTSSGNKMISDYEELKEWWSAEE